jgi:MFS family permease
MRDDPKRERLLEGLPPNVFRLGLVSFFADVSSEMLYPLIPIFLTTVLGAPVAAVGLIEGLAEGTASVLGSVSGWWSDLIKRRKPLVFGGYSLSAVAKPLLGLAGAWPFALFARVLDRAGKGVRDAPRDSLLADSIEPKHRGKAFGWHRGMDSLGAVVGPLLALALLAALHGDIRSILLLAFVPGIAGAALVLFVKDKGSAARAAQRPALRLLPREFRAYLLVWGLFALTNSSDVFLILRARSLGFSTVAVVLAYTLYNLVYALASPVLGGLSDKVGRRRILRVGLVVFTAVYLGFAFARQAWMVWLLFGVYGVYIAATDGVGKALAIDLVPASLRGTAVGVFGMVSGIATVVASVVAGVLWDKVGPYAPFVYGAVGALLAAGLLTIVRMSRTDAPAAQQG